MIAWSSIKAMRSTGITHVKRHRRQRTWRFSRSPNANGVMPSKKQIRSAGGNIRGSAPSSAGDHPSVLGSREWFGIVRKHNGDESSTTGERILSNACGFLGQNVADFFEKDLLARGSAGFFLLLAPQPVDPLDQQEQGNRHNQEIDGNGDEIAPRQD